MLVDAFHAALEDRIEGFDRVGVDFDFTQNGFELAAHTFASAVVHGVMAGERVGKGLAPSMQSPPGHQPRLSAAAAFDTSATPWRMTS
jgi:hypothetical protein